MSFLATALSIVLGMEVILAQVLGFTLQNVVRTLSIYTLWVGWSAASYYVCKNISIDEKYKNLVYCYFYIVGTLALAFAIAKSALYYATFLLLVDVSIILNLALFVCLLWLMLIVGALMNASKLYSKITVLTAGSAVFLLVITRI